MKNWSLVSIGIICVLASHLSSASQAGEPCMLGEVRMFTGNYAPKNWMFANGTTLLSSSHKTLAFILKGKPLDSLTSEATISQNMSTTFNLPDLRSRTIVGADLMLQLKALQDIINQRKYFSTKFPKKEAAMKTTISNIEKIIAFVTHGIAVGFAKNIGKEIITISQDNWPRQNLTSVDVVSNISTKPISLKSARTGSNTTISGIDEIVPANLPVTAVSQTSSPSIKLMNRPPSLGINYIICVDGYRPDYM